jgi:prevent-host-death family protein
MKFSNIHNAKTHLSKLVDMAAKGEEVIICKAGKPMAKIIKFQKELKPRKPGYWEGKVEIADDFDVMPESFMAAFRGERD